MNQALTLFRKTPQWCPAHLPRALREAIQAARVTSERVAAYWSAHRCWADYERRGGAS